MQFHTICLNNIFVLLHVDLNEFFSLKNYLSNSRPFSFFSFANFEIWEPKIHCSWRQIKDLLFWHFFIRSHLFHQSLSGQALSLLSRVEKNATCCCMFYRTSLDNGSSPARMQSSQVEYWSAFDVAVICRQKSRAYTLKANGNLEI